MKKDYKKYAYLETTVNAYKYSRKPLEEQSKEKLIEILESYKEQMLNYRKEVYRLRAKYEYGK